MTKYVLAIDLETRGCRSSLYDDQGQCHGTIYEKIHTRYPKADSCEQRPESWWEALVSSVRNLLSFENQQNKFRKEDVVGISVGGHSLGMVPLDTQGQLLRTWVPIWSDGRAGDQAAQFFSKMNEDVWYQRTGCGFPVANYPLFKSMWLREHRPEIYERVAHVLGSKDYVNYRLTGCLATDPSYASGFGCYDLLKNQYDAEILDLAGLPRHMLPEIVPSTQVIGQLSQEAADQLGLTRQTQVVAGGVSNACVALGAKSLHNGRVVGSLGAASWFALCDNVPHVDLKRRPFVFSHVIPEKYLTINAVFSTGTTLYWLKNTLCQNVLDEEKRTGRNPYFIMEDLAKKSRVGANQLIMNPSLVGAASSNEMRDIRGGFLGLSLNHTQADIIRATMEGVVMSLRVALLQTRAMVTTNDPIRLVGEPMSELGRLLHANILNHPIISNPFGSNASTLGLSVLALIGCGVWSDFEPLETLDTSSDLLTVPEPQYAEQYDRVFHIFNKSFAPLREIAKDWNDDIFLLDEEG